MVDREHTHAEHTVLGGLLITHEVNGTKMGAGVMGVLTI